MSTDISPAPTRSVNPDKETKGPWLGAFDPLREDCFGFLEKVLTYGAVLKAHRWLKYDQVDALEKQGFITVGDRRTSFSRYAVKIGRGMLGEILSDPERSPVLGRIIAITSMGGKKTGRERIEKLRAAGVEFDESALLNDPQILGVLALEEVARLKLAGIDYEAMIAERDAILQQGLRDAWDSNSLGLVAAAAGGPAKRPGQVVTQYLAEYTDIHGNTDDGLRDEVMSLFAIALKSRSALKRMRQSMTTFGDLREFTKAMEDEAPSSRMIDAGYRPSLGGIVAYLQGCCLKPCKALVREHLESGIHGPSLDYLAANGVDFYQDSSGSVRTIRQSKNEDEPELGVEQPGEFGEKKAAEKKKERFLPESRDREDLLLLQHAAQQLRLPDAGDYFGAPTLHSRFVGMRNAAIRVAESMPDFEGKEDAIAELRGDPANPDSSPGWDPSKYPLNAWAPELATAIEAKFPQAKVASLADEYSKVRGIRDIVCQIARTPIEEIPTEFAAAEEHLKHADRATKLGALWRTRTTPELLHSPARPDFVLLASSAGLPIVPPSDPEQRNRLMRQMAENLFSDLALGFVESREHMLTHIKSKWNPSKELLGSSLAECLIHMQEVGIMTPSEVQLADTLYRDKKEDEQIRADIRDADRARRLKVQRELAELANQEPVKTTVQSTMFGDDVGAGRAKGALWEAVVAAETRIKQREADFQSSQRPSEPIVDAPPAAVSPSLESAPSAIPPAPSPESPAIDVSQPGTVRPAVSEEKSTETPAAVHQADVTAVSDHASDPAQTAEIEQPQAAVPAIQPREVADISAEEISRADASPPPRDEAQPSPQVATVDHSAAISPAPVEATSVEVAEAPATKLEGKSDVSKPTKFNLACREGVHDKVYGAEIVEGADGCVVNFWNGRRGGKLNHGTKTNTAVPREEAERLLGSLLKEKLRKGYKHADLDAVTPAKETPLAPPPPVSMEEQGGLVLDEAVVTTVEDALNAVDEITPSAQMPTPETNSAKKQVPAKIAEVQPNFEQLALFDLFVEARTAPAQTEELDLAKSEERNNPEVV